MITAGPDLASRREEHAAANGQDARRQDVLIAIPAYNEERYIGSLVLQARRLGFSVLVIDDGSTDRTAEIAAAAGAVVQRHATNQGKAEALNSAFQYARAHDAEALILLDGDGQHDVAEVEPFICSVYSGEADIVVGSRFLPGSAGQVPRLRQLGQRLMTMLTNVGSGVAVTDSQSGFRAFSRRAIQAILFHTSGFSVEVEMQFLARELQLRLVEVPITAIYAEPPRRNVLKHGAQVLNGVLSLIGRHRPLLFFGSLGLIVLLAGLWLGTVVTTIYQETRVLAVGYGLLTVLLVIAGLLSMFTAVVLHSLRGSFLDLERRISIIDVRTTPARDAG